MLAAAVVVLTAAAPVGPYKLSPAAAESVVVAIQKDRDDTRAWLRDSLTSYLATIARVDFGHRTVLTVGRAPGNDVRLDGEGVADHHLQVSVEGDHFNIKALDAAARFRVGNQELRETTLGPGTIRLGRYALRLSHQGFPALIVFDPRSPHFAAYKGLTYYPPDLGLRYIVALAPDPRPEDVVILSTRGNQRHARRVGWFDFSVGKTACRLEVTRLLEPGVGEDDLSVFFRDSTTGHETYPVGRYVDPRHLPDGRYLLDFNLAYNPACAVSDHYNCPIPTRANTLKVAIRAGEMDSHYH
jgi:uncharacterized protein (DUF1684 family)